LKSSITVIGFPLKGCKFQYDRERLQVQRDLISKFGDALNANPHFHCLALDGVYAAGENGRPTFHLLPAPENEDVLRLTTTVAQRVQSLLQRRGLAGEGEGQDADPLSMNDPGMAPLLASSVRRKVAVGSHNYSRPPGN
jgi:Putative transposase